MSCMGATAKNTIYSPQVKTLQVVVNQDWLSPPVMRMGTDDVLNVAFDELSHTYHRFIYRLERCEADWSTAEDVFESDWLEGFNDYRLHVYDEEDGDEEDVLCAEFRVAESLMNVGLSVTTNTDIDFNLSHQQVAMTVGYGSLSVTNESAQVWTVVMQNGREDTQKVNVRPNYIQPGKLVWEHNRNLIFDAGNEYHKFEVLDVSHTTMGLDRILWDGHHYQAYPFTNAPRRSYVYDEDANGAFYIRNSDNIENDRTCDYVYVNYKLVPAAQYDCDVIVDGDWTTEQDGDYVMSYDESDRSYNARILQKQGYYSYQYLLMRPDGTLRTMPTEGDFYQTENSYQMLVYFKGQGDRTDKLVGYQEVIYK